MLDLDVLLHGIKIFCNIFQIKLLWLFYHIRPAATIDIIRTRKSIQQKISSHPPRHYFRQKRTCTQRPFDQTLGISPFFLHHIYLDLLNFNPWNHKLPYSTLKSIAGKRISYTVISWNLFSLTVISTFTMFPVIMFILQFLWCRLYLRVDAFAAGSHFSHLF